MFIEETKFCPKCGQELKDKKCPNCDFKSKFIFTGKIFLVGVVASLVLSSVATFFIDRQIIKMQMKNAFKSAAENFGKSITGENTETDEDEDNEKKYVPTINDTKKFEGDCGINVTAEIVDTSEYLYMPALSMTIKNVSDKDIEALRFYMIFYDVYGEEIKNDVLLNNHAISDTKIPAGESRDIQFDYFNAKNVKKMEVYLYSTYFADKTEWGDHNAKKNTILKSGKKIEVNGEFK